MSIVFEPSHHSDAGGVLADCRIALVTHYHSAKSEGTKCMGLDVRLSSRTVRELGIRNGDRIVARRDDDGSWWFTLVLTGERGFTVRLGGSKQHGGRKGCGYFRISCTKETAAHLFPDAERSGLSTDRVIELDLVGVEGRQSCFSPARKSSGVVFCPAN